MEIAFTLLGVAVGSGSALAAQLLVRRREERRHWVGIMFEACAKIYMLEDEFMAAVGTADPPPYCQGERFMRWSRGDRAHAGAHLRLVSGNERLHELEVGLRESGRQIWHRARDRGSSAEQEEFGAMLDQHRALLEQFVTEARPSVRRSMSRA